MFSLHIYSQVPYFTKSKLTFLTYRPPLHPQHSGVPRLGVSGHLSDLMNYAFLIQPSTWVGLFSYLGRY